MIEKKIPAFLEHVEQHKNYIDVNHRLFNAYEGELLPQIYASLKNQLSEKSFEQIAHRVAPINVLTRIIDKLSKIYQQNPVRHVENGREQDSELLQWYESCFKIDQKMNVANEFFNMFRSSLIQVYLHNGKPRLRSIPSDSFLAYSDDPVETTEPNHIILIHSDETDKGRKKIIYHAYSNEEFVIYDSDGKVRFDLMEEVGNPEGIVPYGKMPFVYVNRSANLIVPKADIDTLKMSILIPVLLSDLNFAVMFQAFSIIYGIDVTDDNLEMAPNAFWRLRSDDTVDSKPQLGTIKPSVDTDKALSLMQSQMGFWLQTRGIRAGAIGDLGAENFASGISKMVDEMDTSEDRKKQVAYFENAEEELWDFVVNYAHPYWVDTRSIEPITRFSVGAKVITNFQEQIPMLRRADILKETIEEIDAGLLPKKRALKRLNPRLNDEEIDQLLSEIEDEKMFKMELSNGLDESEDTNSRESRATGEGNSRDTDQESNTR